MSRKLFAFLLSELQVVRFICKKCGAVQEMNIDQVDTAFNLPMCRVATCQAIFDGASTGHGNSLTRLGEMLKRCRQDSVGCDIEFVLPDNS